MIVAFVCCNNFQLFYSCKYLLFALLLIERKYITIAAPFILLFDIVILNDYVVKQ